MLNSTTIRPCNWLLDHYFGCYCVVKQIRSLNLVVERYLVGDYEQRISNLKGIIIIRDNLSLANFEPGNGNFHERTINNFHLVVAPIDASIFSWWVNEKFIKEIQFIHELQNAFIDATGEHLKLNLFGAKQ